MQVSTSITLADNMPVDVTFTGFKTGSFKSEKFWGKLENGKIQHLTTTCKTKPKKDAFCDALLAEIDKFLKFNKCDDLPKTSKKELEAIALECEHYVRELELGGKRIKQINDSYMKKLSKNTAKGSR